MSALDRFLEAQKDDYEDALKEIKQGKKTSCWMWYIFPQITGLGFTEMNKKYSIQDIEEGKAYLENETLKSRLIEITQALLDLEDNDARNIMGMDDVKLKSSMTLFKKVEEIYKIDCGNIFQKTLEKFFEGEEDNNTIRILEKQKFEKFKQNNKKLDSEDDNINNENKNEENENVDDNKNDNNNVDKENNNIDNKKIEIENEDNNKDEKDFENKKNEETNEINEKAKIKKESKNDNQEGNDFDLNKSIEDKSFEEEEDNVIKFGKEKVNDMKIEEKKEESIDFNKHNEEGDTNNYQQNEKKEFEINEEKTLKDFGNNEDVQKLITQENNNSNNDPTIGKKISVHFSLPSREQMKKMDSKKSEIEMFVDNNKLDNNTIMVFPYDESSEKKCCPECYIF